MVAITVYVGKHVILETLEVKLYLAFLFLSAFGIRRKRLICFKDGHDWLVHKWVELTCWALWGRLFDHWRKRSLLRHCSGVAVLWWLLAINSVSTQRNRIVVECVEIEARRLTAAIRIEHGHSVHSLLNKISRLGRLEWAMAKLGSPTLLIHHLQVWTERLPELRGHFWGSAVLASNALAVLRAHTHCLQHHTTIRGKGLRVHLHRHLLKLAWWHSTQCSKGRGHLLSFFLAGSLNLRLFVWQGGGNRNQRWRILFHFFVATLWSRFLDRPFAASSAAN